MLDRYAKKAFTLIELLVVIAIIGSLLAVLVPSLTAVKERARRVICTTNLHNISYISNIYAMQNNNKLPVSNWRASAGWVRIGWFNDVPFNVARDLRNDYGIETLFCPSNSLREKPGAKLEDYYLNFLQPAGLSRWEMADGGNIVSDYFWLLTFDADWRKDVMYSVGSRREGKNIFTADLNGKSLCDTPLVVDVVGTSDVDMSRDQADYSNIRGHRYRTNHVKEPKAQGGNALYADNSIRWEDFDDMDVCHSFSDYLLYW